MQSTSSRQLIRATCPCSSRFNPVWKFGATIQGQQCNMFFTSVAGHLMELEFGPAHRGWRSCDPIDLYAAPVNKAVPQVPPPGAVPSPTWSLQTT